MGCPGLSPVLQCCLRQQLHLQPEPRCPGCRLWPPEWTGLLAHQELLGQKLGRERLREGEEGHRPLRRRLPPPDRSHLSLNQNLTLPPKIVSHPGKKTMFE